AEPEAEPDAGSGLAAFGPAHGREGDVVGVLQHRHHAAAVEADIELARQPIERTVIENVMMPSARVGSGVDQLLWVDNGGGRGGDVTDVVWTRSPCAETR